jgi:hypothetical protein
MDPFSSGGGSAEAEICPLDRAPALASVEPGQLAGFKRDLERMIAAREDLRSDERGWDVYEEGIVTADVARTDMEPGEAGVPTSGPRPGGFEMRWLMRGRAVLAGDVLLFEDGDAAAEYLELATDPECRPHVSWHKAAFPAGGHNLQWSNPDGYAQQDVFLRRGRRVYRVSVVQAGAGSTVPDATRAAGFLLADEVACGLPGVACPGKPPRPAPLA